MGDRMMEVFRCVDKSNDAVTATDVAKALDDMDGDTAGKYLRRLAATATSPGSAAASTYEQCPNRPNPQIRALDETPDFRYPCVRSVRLAYRTLRRSCVLPSWYAGVSDTSDRTDTSDTSDTYRARERPMTASHLCRLCRRRPGVSWSDVCLECIEATRQ